MIYLYKRNKTGICIDRVYGYDTIVELPDMLEGFPVTELGAYIFSDHIDSTELKMMQEKENFCTENGRATRPEYAASCGKSCRRNPSSTSAQEDWPVCFL